MVCANPRFSAHVRARPPTPITLHPQLWSHTEIADLTLIPLLRLEAAHATLSVARDGGAGNLCSIDAALGIVRHRRGSRLVPGRRPAPLGSLKAFPSGGALGAAEHSLCVRAPPGVVVIGEHRHEQVSMDTGSDCLRGDHPISSHDREGGQG